VPCKCRDEDILGEVLDRFDVYEYRIAGPRCELVDGEGARGSGDAKVGRGNVCEKVDMAEGVERFCRMLT
jgi:hypothetical protein